MEALIYRAPTPVDWRRCYFLATATEGKFLDRVPEDSWKPRVLMSQHSPIRTLMFTIWLRDIPYYVACHIRTHHSGVEHYITTQRNDRQKVYDRRKAPQDAPVSHILDINAQELAYIAQKRLCGKADPVTRQVIQMMTDAVVRECPEMKQFMVPFCKFWGKCIEMKPCGGLDVVPLSS